MAVVDKAEKDKKVFHDKCLQLMRIHVEQQRQRVQEASERLHKRMKRRERREKVMGIVYILHCLNLDLFIIGSEIAEEANPFSLHSVQRCSIS